MKRYSKEESKKLRIHTFATTTQSGATIVKAHLKENAAKKMNVPVSDVYVYDGFTNSSSCDELVEHVHIEGDKMIETYTIEMKNDH